MNFADVLSGRAKSEGIQWMLCSATARRQLRDQLRAILSPGSVLGSCHLRHMRFKPDQRLTGYYDVQLRSGAKTWYRPIAVTWRSASEAHPRETVALAHMQAEALRRGVAFPFRQLMADALESGTHVQVFPLDAGFIQLVRVSDPQHARAMISHAKAAANRPSHQHSVGEYVVTSFKYRLAKRHVLRYASPDPNAATVFAKLYRGQEGVRAFRATTCAADWLAENAEGVNCVRPLAYLTEDAVVLYPRAPGKPLSACMRYPSQDIARHLARAGAALCALHHLPDANAGPLKLHDFAAETRKTEEASDYIPALLPQLGAAIGALLDRARELHQRLPQEPPTFTHGSFKTEHIWVAPGGLTLIDFDSSCLADPALDVGKFLADWQYWREAYAQAGEDEAGKSFLAGYAPSVPKERLIRARLYEAVALVKYAARRVYPFEHDWAFRTARLVGRAHAVINDLRLTLGLPVRPISVRSPVNSFQNPPRARHAQPHSPTGAGGR